MATVVREYVDEKNGHNMIEYDNGMLYDRSRGRIASPPAVEFRGINSENAASLRRQQIQDAENAIARTIADKTYERGKISRNHPVDAIAAAAGMLWDDVVLNSRSRPRDRREIYEVIGRDAGLRRDARTSSDDGGPPASPVLDVDALRSVIGELERAARALERLKAAQNSHNDLT